MMTILIMTMTIANKDDKGAINWQCLFTLIMANTEDLIAVSNSKDDWMADDTMDG